MVKLVLVVVALCAACGSKNPCEKGDDGKACLKYADEQRGKPGKPSELEQLYEAACDKGAPEGCTKAAELYAAATTYSRSGPLYMRACRDNEPKACFALGKSLRDGDGGQQNTREARVMFKQACDLKNDDACKELAALPADKPAAPPPAIDAGVPAPVSIDAASDDKMTDLAFCGFIVEQLCARCASAHSMTKEACVKRQSVYACAKLTGATTLATPPDFRARCAAGIAKMDCNAQNAGIPAECKPPGT